MRKMKRKTWETIGIVVVCTALVVGILGGLVALFGEEKTTKEISPSFSIGGLKSDGTYLETKESIYTKEVFECRGLTITPDFESQVSYQIFFYDAEGEFLEATPKLTGTFNQVPDTATHARMVIIPKDDTEIKFWEINKYVKELQIEVLVDQTFVADETLAYDKILSENKNLAIYQGTLKLLPEEDYAGDYDCDNPEFVRSWYIIDNSDDDEILLRIPVLEFFARGKYSGPTLQFGYMDYENTGSPLYIYGYEGFLDKSSPFLIEKLAENDEYVYLLINTSNLSDTANLHCGVSVDSVGDIIAVSYTE